MESASASSITLGSHAVVATIVHDCSGNVDSAIASTTSSTGAASGSSCLFANTTNTISSGTDAVEGVRDGADSHALWHSLTVQKDLSEDISCKCHPQSIRGVDNESYHVNSIDNVDPIPAMLRPTGHVNADERKRPSRKAPLDDAGARHRAAVHSDICTHTLRRAVPPANELHHTAGDNGRLRTWSDVNSALKACDALQHRSLASSIKAKKRAGKQVNHCVHKITI